MLISRMASTSTFSSVLFASVTACASGSAHENLKSHRQYKVGRAADDSTAVFNRYPERRRASRTLPNGNAEQEWAFRSNCRVYFEIDKASRKIIAWRYEGGEAVCATPR